MRDIKKTTRFKKDFKRAIKRGLPQDALIEVIGLLVTDTALPDRCRPHKLAGKHTGLWECHISPDWLIIYDLSDDTLSLRRTGTHSDLFK